jgi:hypothetical protein
MGAYWTSGHTFSRSISCAWANSDTHSLHAWSVMRRVQKADNTTAMVCWARWLYAMHHAKNTLSAFSVYPHDLCSFHLHFTSENALEITLPAQDSMQIPSLKPKLCTMINKLPLQWGEGVWSTTAPSWGLPDSNRSLGWERGNQGRASKGRVPNWETQSLQPAKFIRSTLGPPSFCSCPAFYHRMMHHKVLSDAAPSWTSQPNTFLFIINSPVLGILL